MLGEQINVDVYSEPENKDAVAIAANAIKEARSKNKNIVIIDTAGRLAIDEAMMTEVANIKIGGEPPGNTVCGGFHDRPGCGEYCQSLQ